MTKIIKIENYDLEKGSERNKDREHSRYIGCNTGGEHYIVDRKRSYPHGEIRSQVQSFRPLERAYKVIEYSLEDRAAYTEEITDDESGQLGMIAIEIYAETRFGVDGWKELNKKDRSFTEWQDLLFPKDN